MSNSETPSQPFNPPPGTLDACLVLCRLTSPKTFVDSGVTGPHFVALLPTLKEMTEIANADIPQEEKEAKIMQIILAISNQDLAPAVAGIPVAPGLSGAQRETFSLN